MKTAVNKATVDTAKETKINNNHKSRNEFCFQSILKYKIQQKNRKCLEVCCKKVVLKNSHNSHESTCAGVSF